MSTFGEKDIGQNESELEELRAFVDDTDRWINQTLTTLGWTREHVVKVLTYFLFVLSAGCCVGSTLSVISEYSVQILDFSINVKSSEFSNRTG